MRLERLISSIPDITGLRGNIDLDIKDISYDSKKIKQGSLFVAIPGYRTDGHLYVKEAVESGASAVICERWLDDVSVPQIRVKRSRLACSLLAAAFFENPSKKIDLIGVTGTNGKTTTTYLIESILRAAGRKTGVLGTVECRIEDLPLHLDRTTPESVDLQEILAKMVDVGVETAVMEVSSHAIDMERIAGCQFKAAIFTNLSQDHLDFHKTLDKYFQTKLRLFSLSQGNQQPFYVINCDDSYGQRIIESLDVESIRYGIKCKAETKASEIKLSTEGSSFKISNPTGHFYVNLKLKGMFNVYNSLAASAACFSLMIPNSKIREGLEKIDAVPGRFENIQEGQDFLVFVDYAHTPDGLENVLTSAREISQGRIITVFGCGGDRDKTKRPLMGVIAARLSDFTVITSDNPRSEDPLSIITQIETGFLRENPKARYSKVENRHDAIFQAIAIAKTGDIVIIAGKGHETGQIFADRVIPFDDRDVARQAIKELIGYASPHGF